jgi:hypothetical protein
MLRTSALGQIHHHRRKLKRAESGSRADARVPRAQSRAADRPADNPQATGLSSPIGLTARLAALGLLP